jgi:hypothetical protein
MDPCGKLCRRDAELGRNTGDGAAAEAIAAARKAVVVLMLMVLRGFSGVVGVPVRTRVGVSGAQLKRGMGVAVRQGDKQQHDQASDE